MWGRKLEQVAQGAEAEALGQVVRQQAEQVGHHVPVREQVFLAEVVLRVGGLPWCLCACYRKGAKKPTAQVPPSNPNSMGFLHIVKCKP